LLKKGRKEERKKERKERKSLPRLRNLAYVESFCVHGSWDVL
jgi:hypothetical protein